MRTVYRLLVVAGTLTAAACAADEIAGRQPVGPHFTITSSTVTCPDTISVGQSAQCVAYFYDQNNSLVTTTPTWSPATGSILTVNSSGQVTGVGVGSATVQATAAGVTGSKSVYVKPGLSVSIGGPEPVRKLNTCTWIASVSGGTAPYSYTWTKLGGTGTGTGANFTGYLISSMMTLTVNVTDANGVQKSVTRQIVGHANAPDC